MTLPDCMMPDGADPCIGFNEIQTERDRIKNINGILLSALKVATHELNAIRARDGAPQHLDWYRGMPMQNSSCTDEWWDELTETCLAAIALAEPSDEESP